MSTYLLGIDTGTSIIKAALFDATGAEISTATRTTHLSRPQPGWFEMGMHETWEVAGQTIRQVLATADAKPEDVAAVGVTGNMIGAWLIDAAGEPVREAILWCDGRTQPLVTRLQQEQPDFSEIIYRSSGSAMEFGCTLPVLRWLAEHEPESLERAATVLCSKDWICYQLTGSRQLDPTEASVLPGDTHNRSYSETMIGLFGLRPWRHLLPPVVPSESIVGQVTPQAAASTNLAPGTPVVAGAGDVPACTLGAGAVEPGMACTVLGTTCHNSLVVAQPVFEPPNVGLLFCLPGGHWLRTMMNVAGTTNLDWVIEQFSGAELDWESTRSMIFEGIEALAQESPPGAAGVLYLPYLSEVGIIAPVVEPAARAQFFGLTTTHRQADLYRAVYEGVAYAIRDCYSAVKKPAEIRLAGGGARSAFWAQIIADCTGSQVTVPAGSEFGAKGAALLAGIGVGWFSDVGQATQATTWIIRRHNPTKANTATYDRGFVIYQQLRQDLRRAWHMAAE